MNNTVLMGRLTKDTETRTTQSNTMVTNFTLAISRRVKQGEETQTDFINIVTFGKTAEFCSKYFKKGMQVALTGRIQTRTWEHEGTKRYATEVIAEQVYFADSKKSDTEQQNTRDGFVPVDTSDEELPF